MRRGKSENQRTERVPLVDNNKAEHNFIKFPEPYYYTIMIYNTLNNIPYYKRIPILHILTFHIFISIIPLLQERGLLPGPETGLLS